MAATELPSIMPSNSQPENRYWELSSRIADTNTRVTTHEAVCEERAKNIDARLSVIEKGIEKINHWGLLIGFTLVCGMAGLLATLIFKLK
jgi:hypothetical protein